MSLQNNAALTDVDIASDTLTRADGTLLTLTSLPGFVAADNGLPERLVSSVNRDAPDAVTFFLQASMNSIFLNIIFILIIIFYGRPDPARDGHRFTNEPAAIGQ